jgi:ElaB/YqjD/DUF883 family membrane-anchored ribosome-binding protein
MVAYWERSPDRLQVDQQEFIMHTLSNKTDSVGDGKHSHSMATARAGVNGSASGVSREFQNFLADIEDLISEATALTGDDLAVVKSKLMERVSAAKEAVEEMGGQISHRARKTVAVTNEYVHEQPWIAIGAGTATGILIGYLLARRA